LMHGRYASEIQAKSGQVNLANLLPMIKGQ